LYDYGLLYEKKTLNEGVYLTENGPMATILDIFYHAGATWRLLLKINDN